MFSFRKNLIAGAIPIIGLVFLNMLWGVVSGLTSRLDVLVAALPLIGDFATERGFAGAMVGFTVEMLMLIPAIYLGGLFLRGFGLWVGGDIERARTWTRRAKRLKIGWAWRLLVGLAVLADAIEGLTVVRVDEYGSGVTTLGIITKVQRVHHQGKRRWKWQFIVYLGDFPTYILGRWRWSPIERCQKLLPDPPPEIIMTMASTGFAAPNDIGVAEFTEEDLAAIAATLKKKEPMLLAAGLVDPDHPIATEQELSLPSNGESTT